MRRTAAPAEANAVLSLPLGESGFLLPPVGKRKTDGFGFRAPPVADAARKTNPSEGGKAAPAARHRFSLGGSRGRSRAVHRFRRTTAAPANFYFGIFCGILGIIQTGLSFAAEIW